MRRHFQYLKYVLIHKYFVFIAGVKLGVPLSILFWHDWDKFLPSMWFPYARSFYKPNGESHYNPVFEVAWNAHQKRNKHHWQYWMITWDKGNTECLAMPDVYRREMLADWMGAGKAITGKDNTKEWYQSNKDNIKLHSETRAWIENQIEL